MRKHSNKKFKTLEARCSVQTLQGDQTAVLVPLPTLPCTVPSVDLLQPWQRKLLDGYDRGKSKFVCESKKCFAFPQVVEE